MEILSRIESHLLRHKLAPSRFGRGLCNDPRLVFDLRNGRQLRRALHKRIVVHLQDGTKRDHIAEKETKGKVLYG